jgi:hypothetical protein
MARRVSKFAAILYGMAIVGGLGLGAREVVAQPAAMDCSNDGWLFLGACASSVDCTAACQAIHGDQAEGHCYGGCCRCLW